MRNVYDKRMQMPPVGRFKYSFSGIAFLSPRDKEGKNEKGISIRVLWWYN